MFENFIKTTGTMKIILTSLLFVLLYHLFIHLLFAGSHTQLKVFLMMLFELPALVLILVAVVIDIKNYDAEGKENG